MITDYAIYQDPLVPIYEGDTATVRLEWTSDVGSADLADINISWGDYTIEQFLGVTSPQYLSHPFKAASPIGGYDIRVIISDGESQGLANLHLTVINVPPTFCNTDYSNVIMLNTPWPPYAYWRLGELTTGDVAEDYASTHDGTYKGGFILGQPGVISGGSIPDSAVYFDGTGYVDLGALPGFPPGDGCIEAWVKFDDAASATIFYAVGGLQLLKFGTDANKRLYFTIDDIHGDNIVSVITTGTDYNLSDNRWHYLLTTDQHIYVDGKKVATTATRSSGFVGEFTQAYIAYDGSRGTVGTFDEVAIYANKGVESKMVMLHYTAGTITAGDKLLYGRVNITTGAAYLVFALCDPGRTIQRGNLYRAANETYTATVDWGDGIIDSGAVVDGWSVLYHQYAASAGGRITITLYDTHFGITTESIYLAAFYSGSIIGVASGDVLLNTSVKYNDIICLDPTNGCPESTGTCIMLANGIPFYLADGTGVAEGAMISLAVIDYTSVLVLPQDTECRKVGKIPFNALVSP